MHNLTCFESTEYRLKFCLDLSRRERQTTESSECTYEHEIKLILDRCRSESMKVSHRVLSQFDVTRSNGKRTYNPLVFSKANDKRCSSTSCEG